MNAYTTFCGWFLTSDWPFCRSCGQSATGSYLGRAACVRCGAR